MTTAGSFSNVPSLPNEVASGVIVSPPDVGGSVFIESVKSHVPLKDSVPPTVVLSGRGINLTASFIESYSSVSCAAADPLGNMVPSATPEIAESTDRRRNVTSV